MAKEDLLLPVEMGKLEIEPTRTSKPLKEENPFVNKSQQKVCLITRNHVQHLKCSCSLQKSYNHMTICKKKSSKMIKDPVLKILQSRSTINNIKDEGHPAASKFNSISPQNMNSDVLSLCALVDNTNQLRISSEIKRHNVVANEVNNKKKWWKNDISHIKPNKKFALDKPQPGTCSQQVLNPPCDVTIDELASYFETLVHIPKKMSSMAEMMYI